MMIFCSVQVWTGKYAAISPREIVRDLWSVNAMFRGYDQQDAQVRNRVLPDSFLFL